MAKDELDDELREQIDKELNRAYIAGLIDGDGTPQVSIKKDDEYAVGFGLDSYIRISRKKAFSIQLLDDWLIKNSINASVRQYDDRYELTVGKIEDIERFLDLLVPYIQDMYYEFELLLEDLIPKIKEGYHRESKENFLEVVDSIDELREIQGSSSKYTADWFRDEWEM